MLLFCVTKLFLFLYSIFGFHFGHIFSAHMIFICQNNQIETHRKCVYKVNHNTNQSNVIKFMAILYTVLVNLTFTHMNLPHQKHGGRNMAADVTIEKQGYIKTNSRKRKLKRKHTP